ncbi:MAG: M23 family metallopeptidase [Oligoflexia bacterium]|nr:M23 family metallopeptidase [Oligoflexia bacterium]
MSVSANLRSFVLAVVLGCLLSGCSFLSEPAPRKFILYPVQAGDSLVSVGRRFTVTAGELATLNKIPSSVVLRPGQVLRVPYRGQSLAKTARDGSVAKPSGLQQAQAAQPSASSVKALRLSPAFKYVGHLIWPVGAGGGHLSSKFGSRWFSFHEGIDIGGAEGLPIFASHAGQVVYSGSGLRGYGNLVVVRGESLLTVYGHNRLNRVRVGQQVRQGQQIADLGQSGKATGPHLHYETRVKNQQGKYAAVDPLVFYSKQKS